MVESCFPVAKVVLISPDSVDIKDRFVVFGHRASWKGNAEVTVRVIRSVKPK